MTMIKEIDDLRKNLRSLIESIDWSARPAHERIFAESIEGDIDLMEKQICASVKHISMRVAELTKTKQVEEIPSKTRRRRLLK